MRPMARSPGTNDEITNNYSSIYPDKLHGGASGREGTEGRVGAGNTYRSKIWCRVRPALAGAPRRLIRFREKLVTGGAIHNSAQCEIRPIWERTKVFYLLACKYTAITLDLALSITRYRFVLNRASIEACIDAADLCYSRKTLEKEYANISPQNCAVNFACNVSASSIFILKMKRYIEYTVFLQCPRHRVPVPVRLPRKVPRKVRILSSVRDAGVEITACSMNLWVKLLQFAS